MAAVEGYLPTLPARPRRAASAPDSRVPDNFESPRNAWAGERKSLVSKLRYVYRNDEYFQGAIDQFLDAEIGKKYRCEPDVDGDALGLTPDQKHELDKLLLERWTLFSESKRNWADIKRKTNATGIIRAHARSGRMLGDAITLIRYLDKKETGRPWGTCAMTVDPMRIDTPPEFQDDPMVVSGFRVNEYGEELGFYLANKYPLESLGICRILRGNGNIIDMGVKYEYIPRENMFGRQMYVHSFVEDEHDIVRGVPPSASALQTMIDLKELDVTVNKRANWTAKIAAVIESDYPDAEDVLVKASDGSVQKVPIANYIQHQALEWAGEDGYNFDGLEAKKLFVGEKAIFNNPIDEAGNHDTHEKSRLRRISRTQGMSTAQYMQDFAGNNFSAQRQAAISFTGRVKCERGEYADPCADGLYCAFVEEDIAQGNIRIPGVEGTATDQWIWFVSGHNRDLVTRNRWYGPIREEIDETKKLAKYKMLQEMDFLLDETICNEVLDINWMDFRKKKKREADFAASCEESADSTQTIDEIDEPEVVE